MIKILAFLLTLMSSCWAADNTSQEIATRKDIQEKRVLTSIFLGYNSLGNDENGQTLTGTSFEGLVQYVLADKWAIGAAYKQMSLGGSGSGSGLSFRATYALKGHLSNTNEKFIYDKIVAVENNSLESPCICLQVMGSQYYLNSSRNTVPFTGYGVGAYYKYPTKNLSNLIAGLQYETMSNTNSLTAMTLYFGIEFRLF